MLIFFSQSHSSETGLLKEVLLMKTKKSFLQLITRYHVKNLKIKRRNWSILIWPRGFNPFFNPRKSAYLANYCWTQEVVIDKLQFSPKQLIYKRRSKNVINISFYFRWSCLCRKLRFTSTSCWTVLTVFKGGKKIYWSSLRMTNSYSKHRNSSRWSNILQHRTAAQENLTVKSATASN